MTPQVSEIEPLAGPFLAFIGNAHWWEIVVILAVVLLLFGNRLPSMARNIGRSFTEFKKGIKGDGAKEIGRDQDAGTPGSKAAPEAREGSRE